MKRNISQKKKTEIYDKNIRPLMAQIISICKENKMSFAAQFMVNSRDSFISSWSRQPCNKHISQVLDAMLFDDAESEEKAIATPHSNRPASERTS